MMRTSRVTAKLKPSDKPKSASPGVSNGSFPNRSETGFLLLSGDLKPLYLNARAAEILLHPEQPKATNDVRKRLVSKIRAMVANGGPNGQMSACKEFLSGSRRYVCQLFDVDTPGNGLNGSKGSSMALLLERSPRAIADMATICEQYRLTPREGQTVRFLLQGLASKEIAAKMGISPNTVKVFLRLAMVKMGVTSRSGIMSKFIHAKT
jgi:DNA-binding CsgD family transcriptional regulator